MPSERIQRQVDRLLDEAEAAADAQQWPDVRRIAQEVLGLDPDNDDAPALSRTAGSFTGGPAESVTPAPTPQPAAPSSFAASKFLEQYGAKLYLDQVIAKKLELQGVGSSDGSDGITIVAPEPGETMPSGGAPGE